MRVSLLVLCVTIIVLVGCEPAAPALASVGSGPAFDPVAFFDGHTRSWGVLEGRAGAPTEWISTDSHGEIDGADRLRMVQHLTFQDGTTQERDWVVWRSGPGQFQATANDMLGSAKGRATGNIFHWQWVLVRSPHNSLMNITMNQWMYRMEDGSVMIRSTISKFDVIVAEVTEQFVHPDKKEIVE